MIVGSALSVNCLQNGHSRSPKYCIVTGAFGIAERVAALRDALQQRHHFRAGGLRRCTFRSGRVFGAAAAGRDQDDRDDHDDHARDPAKLDQPLALGALRRMCFLLGLAVGTRLLAALLAGQIRVGTRGLMDATFAHFA